MHPDNTNIAVFLEENPARDQELLLEQKIAENEDDWIVRQMLGNETERRIITKMINRRMI